MSKEILVEILKAAGMDGAQLKKLHQEFERRHPAEHEELLRFLGIKDAERAAIRAGSRQG